MARRAVLRELDPGRWEREVEGEVTDGLTGGGEHVLGWDPDVIYVAAE